MTTRKITITALFAAIATILMYIEFPLPLMPPFLKVDISGAVILIAVVALGLRQGLFVLAIKDLIHLMSTKTGGVGELADFIMLAAMAVTLYLVMKKVSGGKGVFLGSVISIFSLVIVGMLTNRYMLIPFYSKTMMPLEAIISLCQNVNPNITSINGYIVWGVLPFNIIKGLIVSFMTVILHRKIGSVITKNAQ
ncbi:MAG: ECF transporter S component [Clostridia bacterium]|nr:ECF transporter S component [Clostridia bacterium]